MEASGAVAGHARHVGTLMGPMLLLAFWAAWSDLRAWMHRQGDQLASTSVLVAAATSIGAGAIHALVTPAHVTEDPLYGAFFAAAAAAQVAWGVQVVRRPTRRALVGGAAGNAFLMVLWAQTRLIAIPVGAAAGRRERVGVLDVTCVLLEAVVLACALRPVSVAARSGPG
jgi:hypothetical protein